MMITKAKAASFMKHLGQPITKKGHFAHCKLFSPFQINPPFIFQALNIMLRDYQNSRTTSKRIS